jgi:hypothetical protein
MRPLRPLIPGAALLAALLLSACSSATQDPLLDGGAVDGGPSDSGTPDAGAADGGADGGDVVTGDTYLPWEGGPAYYAKWAHGPPSDPDHFPIAVWLQSPGSAEAYAEIGVNTFIGLWNGTTDAELSTLAAAGMPVISDQADDWSSHLDDPILQGWTQQDEPDNAQDDGNGGYLPCVEPSVIQSRYQTFTTNDATRPVFLSFGQGAAWDDWYGRGTCTGDTASYVEYAKGGDILSFDIYPVNSTDDAVKDKLWLVAQGVDHVRTYSDQQKPVWVWLETTGYNDPSGTPSPAQIRAETWMALVHGARGIGWFCHIFSPSFDETGLLDVPDSKAAVAALDALITSLAPVLNTRSLANGATVASSEPAIPVDLMVKRHGGALYVFAVAMRPGSTTATFQVRDPQSGQVEVIGESRSLTLTDGTFQDGFAADYAVHLYRITQP